MSRRNRSFLLLAGIGTVRFSEAGAGPACPAAEAHGPEAVDEVPTDRPSASAVTSGSGTPTLVHFAPSRIDPPVRTRVRPASEPMARPAGLPGASSFACARYARQTVSESS